LGLFKGEVLAERVLGVVAVLSVNIATDQVFDWRLLDNAEPSSCKLPFEIYYFPCLDTFKGVSNEQLLQILQATG
jgi:hypothetical protein